MGLAGAVSGVGRGSPRADAGGTATRRSLRYQGFLGFRGLGFRGLGVWGSGFRGRRRRRGGGFREEGLGDWG